MKTEEELRAKIEECEKAIKHNQYVLGNPHVDRRDIDHLLSNIHADAKTVQVLKWVLRDDN
jgi:hypothetical protein